MKNHLSLLCLILTILGCKESDNRPELSRFKGVKGLIYYQPPSSGSMTTCVFMPYSKSNFTLKSDDIGESNDFRTGLKFFVFNWSIKTKLYSNNTGQVTLNKDTSQKAYLVRNVEIFFHINRQLFNEKNVIDDKISSDLLKWGNSENRYGYYFSNVDIDSLIINK